VTDRCHELRELLAGYRDGELSPEEARRVAAHVADCPDCTEALSRDRELEAVLADGSVTRTASEWETLAARVEDALDAAERAPAAVSARRVVRWPLARRLALSSLGTVAVALLVFLLHPWQKALVPESEAPVPPASPGLASGPVPGRPTPVEHEEVRALGYVGDAPARPSAEKDLASASRESRAIRDQGTAEPEVLAKVKLSEAQPRLAERKVESAVTPPAEPLGPTARAAPQVRLEETEAKISRSSGIVIASPQAETAARLLPDEVPALEPAPPPGGARSPDEVARWLGAGAEVAGRSSGEALAASALHRANLLVSQGRRDEARTGLVLLTGDFPGNAVRAEAWSALLDLDADAALRSREPATILTTALSLDAFLERYPQHGSAESIRERQVLVWARLATLDATYCPVARERIMTWEVSVGAGGSPATKAAVAELRDGPCSR